MTQEEILEYNKRCAEFLGFKYKNQSKFWARYPLDNSSFLSQKGYMKMDNLKFHSDWNWIMEVVEGIEKLEYIERVDIDSTHVLIRYKDWYTLAQKQSKKEAVVQAINQFLIWYKEQTL